MGHHHQASLYHPREEPGIPPTHYSTKKAVNSLHGFVVDCVPRQLHNLRRPRSKSSQLPQEIVALKHKILQHHRESWPPRTRSSRFSFSAMKRVFAPPVAIPKEMQSDTAVALLVAGRYVPFTREMFARRKNLLKRFSTLDPIDENYRMYMRPIFSDFGFPGSSNGRRNSTNSANSTLYSFSAQMAAASGTSSAVNSRSGVTPQQRNEFDTWRLRQMHQGQQNNLTQRHLVQAPRPIFASTDRQSSSSHISTQCAVPPQVSKGRSFSFPSNRHQQQRQQPQPYTTLVY